MLLVLFGWDILVLNDDGSSVLPIGILLEANVFLGEHLDTVVLLGGGQIGHVNEHFLSLTHSLI